MAKIRNIGVYENTLKDGTPSFRASITHGGKHISLGSFSDANTAAVVYKEARHILSDNDFSISSYNSSMYLPFEKCVCLINYRDKGMYIANPIYLEKKYFLYYLSPTLIYKFDIDDLFYYSSHKIMKRGNHLFVADYGSQLSVLARYGIKSYAVEGRDYHFANDDPTDLRYENIIILNRYRGVRQFVHKGFVRYKTVIHVKSNYVVGKYNTEAEAAIAYNKAADILKKNGIEKNFSQNYVEDLTPSQYADIYTKIKISKRIYDVH
jgi:PKD repeat protein